MGGEPLAQLTAALGYAFERRDLLEEALSHPSVIGADGGRSYERLEFLGDRVLGLAVAEMLFHQFSHEHEGDLARRHAALVSGDSLAAVARDLDLERFLILSPGEARAGSASRPSILADACEAVIGAVYLDGGLGPAAAMVARLWKPLVSTAAPPIDAKTELQEWAQGRGRPLPAYTTISAEGPPHQPVFTMEVRVKGLEPARATGRSKRAAEQDAARALLDQAKRRDG